MPGPLSTAINNKINDYLNSPAKTQDDDSGVKTYAVPKEKPIKVISKTEYNPSAGRHIKTFPSANDFGKNKSAPSQSIGGNGQVQRNEERTMKTFSEFTAQLDEAKKKKDPCWDNYEQIGTKEKNGKEVPNCVPVNESEIYHDGKGNYRDDEGNTWRGSPNAPRGTTKASNYRGGYSKPRPVATPKPHHIHIDGKPWSKDGKPVEFNGAAHANKAADTIRKRNPEAEVSVHMKESVELNEATYQGKEVPLNKRLPGDVKKSKVFVKDGDKVKKVNFGDKNMTIKKNIPARRKSFRARHNCANPGPKTKARYWSCKAW